MFEQLTFDLGLKKDLTVDLGEVFTRRWVVDLILDLAHYTRERDLGALVAVEPACGDGAFLSPMVDRLLESAAAHNRPWKTLSGCIRAYDLAPTNVERARKVVTKRLTDGGVELSDAEALARAWVQCDDFLLSEAAGADLVVGNPPYIRLENVPPERSLAYRDACQTMRGRSDVYVGFIERGLRLLREDGTLAFIVADRWMHNEYGAALRELISREFSVDTVIEMHDVDAFEDAVSAYPAIVIIRNAAQGKAVVAQADAGFDATGATALKTWTHGGRGQSFRRTGCVATRLPGWFEGRELWPAGNPEALALIAELEQQFEPLEDAATGTRVGIGVASGADSVFITRDAGLVEPDRLLPLVSTTDIARGEVEWSGRYLVSPWDEDGLVDLAEFPRLRAYYAANATRLGSRHVALKRPESWYRTIDRVDPALLARPKLLLPDIKAASHPVLESGSLYPHHNLYFVVSDAWDLEVLGGLLLSDVANLFVGAYCVKMRGGCFRFQAQYIRRIRVPGPADLSNRQAQALRKAFRSRDVSAATIAAMQVYGIADLPPLR